MSTTATEDTRALRRGSDEVVSRPTARRLVAALATSTFVEWAGASSVIPLLPLYLRDHGATDAVVGATMAAFFLAAVVVQYPVGRLSDRIGRRPIQLGGLATYAIASLVFAAVATPVAALLLRGLQGCGAGVVDVANNATVGDVVPAGQQGRAYGALFAARTAGIAIGPFFGGFVGVHAMRWLLVGAAVSTLLACIPVLVAVPRTKPEHHERTSARVPLWKSRIVLGAAFGYAAAGLVIGVYEVCWSLLLHLRGASSWQIGLSWTLFALPFAAISVPAGWLVDHFDRRVLAAGSTLASAAFAATYPWLHSVWLLVGLGAAEAVTVAVAGPALAAQIARHVPSRDLGRAQGAVSTAQTGATGLSALAAGALFAVAPWVPFTVASLGIVVLVGLLVYCWRPSEQPSEQRSEGRAERSPEGRAEVPFEAMG